MEKINPIKNKRVANWAYNTPWSINNSTVTPAAPVTPPSVTPQPVGGKSIWDNIFNGLTGVGNLVSSHLLGQQQIEANARNMQELSKHGYLNQDINPGSPLAGIVGTAYPQQYRQMQEQSNTRRLLIFGGIAILAVILILKFAKK